MAPLSIPLHPFIESGLVAVPASLARVLSLGKVWQRLEGSKNGAGHLRMGSHLDLVTVGPVGPII